MQLNVIKHVDNKEHFGFKLCEEFHNETVEIQLPKSIGTGIYANNT